MAKSEGELHRVVVFKLEVEIDEAGTMHEAVLSTTDAEDHSKVTERRFPHVGAALDNVLNNLLTAKLDAVRVEHQMDSFGPGGNA